MNEKEKKIGYKDIFRQREYMKMILAALINRFGDSIDAIAAAWIVYEISGNAAWSAVIFGINYLPSVVITPLAGAWVEGKKKKTIMVITDLIRAFCVACVATLYLIGILQPWMLMITTLTISTAEAFRGPASTALLPKILDKEYFEYGLSLAGTLSKITEIIGTASAAAIIALIGSAGAIYIDMATFIMSAVIIMFVNSKEENLVARKFDKEAYFGDLKDGFSYVKKDKALKLMIILSVFLNGILVPLNSLEAPLANEILGTGAEVLSIIGIFATVGMILGTITYPMLKKRLSGKAMWIGSGIGEALFYILIVACKPLYTSLIVVYTITAALCFVLGYVVSVVTSYVSLYLVKGIDENYLARISGISSAIGMASLPIMSFVVSAAVSVTNTKIIFIIAGSISVIFTVCMFFNKILSEELTEDNEEVPLREVLE